MTKSRLRWITAAAALLAAPGFLFVTLDALFKAADAPPAMVETLERGPERAAVAVRGAERRIRSGGARMRGTGERPSPRPPEPAPPVPAGPDELAVPIIVYHNIRAENEPHRRVDEPYFVTPAQLEAELAFLQASGYASVSFDDLIAAFDGRPLPAKPIVISFDDGRDNQYGTAFPLLARHGFKATFFVFTNAIGRPGYMTWDQLRAMRDAGMAVGSHTVYHPYLKKADDETLRREVVDSKAKIEAELGVPVTAFAYPFGLYDERVTAAVRDAGYLAGRGLRHADDVRADGLFELPGHIAVGDLKAFRRMLGENVR
ncbi:MAG TPA: polysaccharide deacetylase family protein [Candidatus Binatia bacterium]|jgi:peptidoglycan/xylan/chitin deacetylase (PgdA/CDA1 family)|nr:polysaccharide deacetylase family protein [Candidatus Binatia bacterium]